MKDVQVMKRLLFLLLVCACVPFVIEDTRFACQTNTDCVGGFVCLDVGNGLECVSSSVSLEDGGVDAGDSGLMGVDAGSDAGQPEDAGTDAGETDAGIDGGGVDAGPPPTKLAFGVAPQTVKQGTCVALNIRSVMDNNGPRPVSTATVLDLSANPAGLIFYRQPTCSTAITSVTLIALSSSVTFYAQSFTANTYTITVQTPSLTAATQPLIVRAEPDTLLISPALPTSALGGTCLPMTVVTLRGAVQVPVLEDTLLTLSSAPPQGALFYSNESCTTPITSATMPADTSSINLYVKPLTAGTNRVAVTAFDNDSEDINTTQIVRSGACSFTPAGLSATCTFSPPLSDRTHAMLLTQATAVLTNNFGAAQARCRLSSTTDLVCTRERASTTITTVAYQIAEVPQGLLVQTNTSASCTATFSWTTPAPLNQSFVLKTLANNTGVFEAADTARVWMTSTTMGSMVPSSCPSRDVQINSWSGLTVDRAIIDGATIGTSTNYLISGLPAVSANAAVIIQPVLGVAGSVSCGMVRASMPSPTSIVLTRSAGTAATCAKLVGSVGYERIDFGSKALVKEYPASLAINQLSVDVAITAVDVSRTIVFASSQQIGGQGVGESGSSHFSDFTDGLFRTELTSPTTVTVIREGMAAPAMVTFYVAELNP